MQPSALLSVVLTLLGAINSISAHAIPTARSSSDYSIRTEEIGWCLIPWHSLSCIKGQGHADQASNEAAKLFPSSLHNGVGDAFRHCYWNARMTIDMGPDTAEAIGDNHEEASSGPQAEKDMDLANNASGRGYGLSAGGTTEEAKYANAKGACQRAAETGKLVTLN